jgi:hypothetical protein
MLRAGTYLGVPKPPFTPGYELVGVVEELGPGCSRLKMGDRIGTLTVWGADAERVCVLEENAVEVPEDVDPGEVLSLVFIYMTAYQLLHRTAKVERGETVLVHGAAGRVGTAVLELGAVAGLRMYGTCSARDRAAVERLGAVAIDYRNEDFLARVRGLPGKGVDVVLDGLGGVLSLRSFRALRPGGRLVVYGHSSTIANGHRSWRGWIEWYGATAAVELWGLLSPRRRCPLTGSRSCARATSSFRWGAAGRFRWAEAPATRSGSGRTSACSSSCSARARSTRSLPSACGSPMRAVRTSCWRARRPRGSSYSCRRRGARRRHDYLLIAEYGVTGDSRSVALVGTDGTIDSYRPGRFDRSSGPSDPAARTVLPELTRICTHLGQI